MAEDLTREAQKIWNALRVMVDQEIDQRTASCVRSRKMTVMSAPNGSTVGVAEPFGQTVNIPYSSALANVKVGDTVWVDWKFDNASTMVAMATGDGQIVPDYFDYNDANRNLLEARKFIQTSLSNQGDLVDPTADTVPMDYTGVGTSNYYIHVSPSTKYRLTLYDTRIEADSVSCVVAQYASNGTFISLAASGIGWRDPQGMTFVTNVNAAFLRLSLVGFPKYRWKLEQGEISTDWQPSPEDVSPYTFDTVPTNNSENPITSGGVYNALATKVSKSGDTMTGDLATPKVTLIAPNVDWSTAPSSNKHDDVIFVTDKYGDSAGIMRLNQTTTNDEGLEFGARRIIGANTKFNTLHLNIAPDGTRSVTVSDSDAWCTGIGAVNKAGDTMTGALVATTMKVYDASYPMFVLQSSASDVSALGAVYENLANRQLVFRQRSTAGYVEDYYLPVNSATSANVGYEVITGKGGTMTGDLTAPNYIVKGSAAGVNPSVMGLNQNGQSLGTVDFFTDGTVQIRGYKVGVGSENYRLPTPTSGSGTVYQIMTTKTPVTGFKDMTISISLASATWVQQSITQFATPTGYVRTGISVVGGSTTNIRSYVYVLTNANANWVLLYNASGSSLSGTVTLRASYILQSMSEEFTQ